MMTRFMGEIMGLYGEYFQKSARKEVASMRDSFLNGEIIIEDDGAVKWASSGNYLPDECVEKLAIALCHDGDPVFNAEATKINRKAQDEETLSRIIGSRKNAAVSDEERYEMECAFGKGTTIVNVLTGEKFML